MSGDTFEQRGKALEDMFFKNVNDKLLQKLREERQAKEAREALGPILGINDPATLDALAQQGITAETSQAISIIPLVAIAWSDGVLEDAERSAIERACQDVGIDSNSTHYELIRNWLEKSPSTDLFATWIDYVQTLKGHLDPAALTQLKNAVIGRAQTVAKAAGGFLGLGNKISDSEKRVLDKLEAAFK